MNQAISREIQIDYGHTLPEHYSFCNQIHGHRARIVAHFSGDIKQSGSENGMIIDFGICKTIMMEKIHAILDHGFAVWKNDIGEYPIYPETMDMTSLRPRDIKIIQPNIITTLQFILKRNKKYLICDEPPTAEYLSAWALEQIKKGLLDKKRTDVRVFAVEWWETPNNCAVTQEPKQGDATIIETITEVEFKK